MKHEIAESHAQVVTRGDKSCELWRITCRCGGVVVGITKEDASELFLDHVRLSERLVTLSRRPWRLLWW